MKNTQHKADYAVIAGYASTFDNIDKNNHIVSPQAFLQQDFSEKIPILFQHKKDQILGTTLKTRIDEKGLYIEAALFLQTKLQNQVYDLIKQNRVRGMSVGLKVESSKQEMGILKIRKAQVLEISLTPNPVNSSCSIGFCERF